MAVCFIPMDQRQKAPTDYRVLYLEMEFYQIPFCTLIEAAVSFFRAVNTFQNQQFVMDWDVNDKRVSLKTIENKIKNSKDKVVICADGLVKSGEIYNQSTFHRYYRDGLLGKSIKTPSSYSIDYPDYFQAKIAPFLEDDLLLKKAILEMFQDDQKTPLGNGNWLDSGCLFLGYKYYHKTNPELFQGKLMYDVSVDACERDLDEAAEQLGSILLSLAGVLKHANGRIGIAPQKVSHISPYMTYFGEGYDNVDGSHKETEFSPREWYPYYYIQGVEWMNLLSALPAGRIDKRKLNTNGIYSFEANGELVIRSTYPISQIHIRDLAKIKSVISSVLFPGKSVIDLKKIYCSDFESYSMLPRSNWEAVPISSDEVHVKNSVVTFSHLDQGTLV